MAGGHNTRPAIASVEHSSQSLSTLSCPRGGFPSIRHNEIRDITADLLSEVCHAVGTELCLQPVAGEVFKHKTADREVSAGVDIIAQGFLGSDRQCTFLMFGYSILLHRAIATPSLVNAIDTMT